ncbi:MAG: type II secretion system GspH family protein [Lentisphaerales bacterium]|nr:type II secretion system GspH family protein [Lentisphaerales bacterium]
MKKFTLVELLVVIAILGMLITILLPAISKSRAVSRTAVCLSQLKQLSMAYMMYVREESGRTIPRRPRYPINNFIWLGAIFPYHKSPDLLKCPSATHLSTDTPAQNVPGSAKTGWAGDTGYWSIEGHKGRGSYAINGWTWSRDLDGILTDNSRFYRTIANVENASNTPLFFDSSWIDAMPNRNHMPTSSDGVSTDNNSKRIYLDRHGKKKVNHVMIDGSAKSIFIDKLYYLDWNKTFEYKDLPLL